MYVGTYLGLKEVQGWPTSDPLPGSFRLIWAKVDQPDKRTNTQGQIYLWVRTIDVAERITGEPRAYKLPFHTALAEQVQDALDKLEGGATLNGQRTRGLLKQDPEMEIPSNPQALADEASAATGFNDGQVLLEFTELPRAVLPAKAI